MERGRKRKETWKGSYFGRRETLKGEGKGRPTKTGTFVLCTKEKWKKIDFYLHETLQQHVRIERLPRCPRLLHHWRQVLLPEHPVCLVDLRGVAEEPLGVDLRQDAARLEVQQAVQEQLKCEKEMHTFNTIHGTIRTLTILAFPYRHHNRNR